MIHCRHSGCGHQSEDRATHLDHDAIHFTASVMGNPEYLVAIKDIPPAPDERMVGLEQMNAYHGAARAERDKRPLGSR